MRYKNSNFRYAKATASVIQPYIDPADTFVQLYANRCHVGSYVKSHSKMFHVADPYMYSLWVAMFSGWEPPLYIGRDLYYWLKDNRGDLKPHLSCFVGRSMSVKGEFWGPYNDMSFRQANIAIEAYKSLMRTMKFMEENTDEPIEFTEIIPDYVGAHVYVDISYKDDKEKNKILNLVNSIADRSVVYLCDFKRPPFDFHRVWNFPESVKPIPSIYMIERH